MVIFMKNVFQMHWAMVKRHPLAGGMVFLMGVIIMLEGFWRGELVRRASYLAVILLSVVIVDWFYLRRPGSAAPLPVRCPKLELLVAGVLLLVSLTWLILHFQGHYAPVALVIRLLWVGVGVLAVFNIGLALFLLLVLRYVLKELGLQFVGLAPVPVVIFCFGMTAWVSHSGVTWQEVVNEVNGRVWLVPLVSFFVAALPEEFFRMIWQTRLGAVLKNPAMGWLVASMLWAFLHVPNFNGDLHHVFRACQVAFDMVPLGLLWGYFTFRSQSIVPAICLHGTNVWGLHNF